MSIPATRSYRAGQISACTGIGVSTISKLMRDGEIESFIPRGLTKPRYAKREAVEEWFGGPLPNDIDTYPIDCKGILAIKEDERCSH